MALAVRVEHVAQPAPHVHERLGGGQDAERDRQRAAVVHVVEPEAGARELPLHVAVSLRGGCVAVLFFYLLQIFKVKILF